MISERPSGDGPSVSIGNYKGVMLCNRPFAGVTAAARASQNTQSKAPFSSAVCNREPLGLQPAKQHGVAIAGERQRANKNKNSVLSKHKKWLSDLQKAKEEYQNQAAAADREAKERKQRFMERQAELRSEVRKTMDVEPVQESKAERARRSKKQRNKPRWAMTEEEADMFEDEEALDLVGFAESLDFEKYLDDLEVRAALESVRNRVQELESNPPENEDEEWEEYSDGSYSDGVDSDGASEYSLAEGGTAEQPGAGRRRRRRRRRRKLTRDSLKDHETSSGRLDGGRRLPRGGTAAGGEDDDDDIASVVSSVMTSSSSIRQVHSARSLAALAKRVAANRQASKLAGIQEEVEGGQLPAAAHPVPRIAINHARPKSREIDPSNLPYMHRNPAI